MVNKRQEFYKYYQMRIPSNDKVSGFDKVFIIDNTLMFGGGFQIVKILVKFSQNY